ncbi:hypothetical protein HY485_00025, partial [Candidatus Woesearchaeota archaeon]|nr:hypothetical protein [Candidatus Woesearchaeota archaeon]
ELTKESDIDLFFDCNKKNEEFLKRIVDSAILNFESSKDYDKWKLLHFTYPFSVQVGIINEWQLKSSIASEGILLYTNKPAIITGERSVLFVMHHPKKKKDYIRIRRLLFGRDEEFYKGKGAVQQANGKKLSNNVFIVPQAQQKDIMDILSKEKIDFSMTEIIMR